MARFERKSFRNVGQRPDVDLSIDPGALSDDQDLVTDDPSADFPVDAEGVVESQLAGDTGATANPGAFSMTDVKICSAASSCPVRMA